ncbi:MAG TPA: hypothetical protein DDW50_16020 [Firmicutes bacterium]|jgi:hypothetical protein|nr:hypothetical protein [Bacillota bacterium]
MEVIFENSWLELLKRDGKYFLRFDAGELAVQMQELEITPEEAAKVRKNPDDAYPIILKYQNKALFGQVDSV